MAKELELKYGCNPNQKPARIFMKEGELPIEVTMKKIYFVDGLPLSPLANAYVRARGADRMSSYGDFIALSDICDEETARFINREVSDGVIAPGYTDAALEILKAKRKGTYNVIKIDPEYVPAPIETKEVFGVTFEQGRNEIKLNGDDLFQNIPTQNKNFTDAAGRPGNRYRCRTAEPYPLYSPCRKQGRHLVFTPASEGIELAMG